jgi:hypothetical protein
MTHLWYGPTRSDEDDIARLKRRMLGLLREVTRRLRALQIAGRIFRINNDPLLRERLS